MATDNKDESFIETKVRDFNKDNVDKSTGVIKKAFIDTIPVMTGYLVLGFGFGIIVKANGYSILLAFAMSFLIYAGSMQYVAINLINGGASFIAIALTTLMVNARHLFYGISMLDKYRNTGKRKPYLIFSLTDETYSLVVRDNNHIPEKDKKTYYLLVSVMNQTYWVMGSLLGAVAGSVITFNSKGIDFALTALFLTVFIEQWLTTKNHGPAIIGVVTSIICLVVFGGDRFLIPTMIIITLLLGVYTEASSENEKVIESNYSPCKKEAKEVDSYE